MRHHARSPKGFRRVDQARTPRLSVLLLTVVGCPPPAQPAPPVPRQISSSPVVCRLESVPKEVVEEGELEVTVFCSLPPDRPLTPLNCELKGTGPEVLRTHRRMVRGVTRQRFTFAAPSAKEAASLIVAAWLGTDWQQPVVPIAFSEPIGVVSRESMDRRRRSEAQAEAILTGLHYRRSVKGNIALPAADWPGQDRSVPDVLTSALRRRGYEVTPLDGEAFLNPFVTTPERFDLLIIPNGRRLPVEAAGTINRYLRDRGNLLVLGAPLFADPLRRVGDRWMTAAEVEAALKATPTAKVLFDFESGGPEGWSRSSNNPQAPATFAVEGPGASDSKRSMHVRISELTGWESFHSPPLPQGAVPPGHTLTCFWARGGSHTPRLAIEWNEHDGSRWFAVVALTSEWQYYVLTPDRFTYWHDSPTGARRGASGDRFNPANGARLGFGLAFTHTGHAGGAHEFWVDQVGLAANPLGDSAEPGRPDFPATDLLWPSYKVYRATEVARIRTNWMQALVDPSDLPLPKVLFCPHQRPQGTGFNKGRAWRMITVAEAVGGDGEFRGPALSVLVNQPKVGRAHVWAMMGSDEAAFLSAPRTVAALCDVAERIIDGVFLLEGGSEFYTCRQGESIRLGARVVGVRREDSREIGVRLRVLAGGAEVFGQAFAGAVRSGKAPTVFESTWGPDRLNPNGYSVVVELIRDGRVVDRVQHELGVWHPKANPQFVTARDGDFYLAGRKWYPYGVNHMPASGIGIEDGHYFEQYLGRRSYDPEIFDRELHRIRALGMNMVSAFIYHESHADRNLLDYLRRCEKYGLKVNLSLRPGTPMDFEWPKMRQMIVENHLAENDTVFAYDLAWEPFIGRHAERTRWDKLWGEWIQRRYGSIDAAERAWSFAAPRNKEGYVTNPPDMACGRDGPWRKLVCDYRRFIDELVERHYGEARRLVRSVDPHHLVSFRMTVAGDPTFDQAQNMPYDFRSLATCVDIFEPEGYGRIGDWQQVKPGLFTVAYARAVDRTKPILWAEFGVSTWDGNAMETSARNLDFQARFYDDFLKMVLQSGANGAVCWWYPGGFRVGENSDFGIINPDGTDRPVSAVLRKYATLLTQPRDLPQPTEWIEYNPDDPAGVQGIYNQVSQRFWQALDGGKVPGLKSSGVK